MSEQKECMQCGGEWAWNDEDVFDFDKPVGKRIWPAVCFDCRKSLETRYKTGTLTYNELLMEFSTISGRISKKCAVSGNAALARLRTFEPRKRGKHR